MISHWSVTVAVGLMVLIGSLGSSSVHAEDKRWDIGIRAMMLSAGGEPTNDQTGGGIFGRYRFNEKWLVGLAVDELSGDFDFDITTDAGSETLLSVGGGLRRGFAKWFGFEVEAQADQHFADWKLTDRDNGTTATLDDYLTWGINLGLYVTF